MPRIRASSIDEHKELTRRALLGAAYRLIDEAGTAEIPLGEIALAAGVGRTTLYDYFEDRDDVIASLVEAELPQVIEELIAEVPDDLSVDERLVRLATDTVRFVATNTVFGVILHREAGRMGQEAQKRIRESHSDLAKDMAATYIKGVEEGVFISIPPYFAGRLIQDTIMSAAKALIDDRSRADEVTDALERFLMSGLGRTDRQTPMSRPS